MSRYLAALALVILIPCGNFSALARRIEPIELTPGPQLFVDEYLIAESNLVRKVNSPERLPDPVVTGTEDQCEQPFFTVLRDPQTRRFRIWYGIPGVDGAAPPSRMGYMESEDGIHWIRPHRILDVAGELRIHYGTSIVDSGPSSDPSTRYKLGFIWQGKPLGLMIATSPDGLTWKLVSAKPPVLEHTHDIDNIFWDTIRHHYIATVSMEVAHPGWPTDWRAPYQSFSDDLIHWTSPHEVIAPDTFDEGEFQYYAMSGYVARGPLIIGLAKVLRNELPADPGGPVVGIGYTALTWTRDGTHWVREKTPFMDRNPAKGAFDHAMTWGESQLVTDDKTYIYYAGYKQGHKINRYSERQIGLAIMPCDRYIARETIGNAVGELLTTILKIDGSSFTINANIHGELRVRVLDEMGRPIPGLDFTDCTPIHGDSTRHIVQWKKPLKKVAGRNVRLEFQITNGSLYAFDILK